MSHNCNGKIVSQIKRFEEKFEYEKSVFYCIKEIT